MILSEIEKAETRGVHGGPQLSPSLTNRPAFTTGCASLEQLKSAKSSRVPRPNRSQPRPRSSEQ